MCPIVNGRRRPTGLGRLTLTSESSRPELSQIKSRERVRDLAEVYTGKREVDAMLDLVAEMFPSAADSGNTDRTFLEPACGSGNFLEEILRRKLAYATTRRYGRGEHYEHRILRCLASIYGIDISADNVAESRDRLRALVNAHLDVELGSELASLGFLSAAETILATNIVQADAITDATRIELVEYRPGPGCTFSRAWSFLDGGQRIPDLFSPLPRRDEAPVHYSQLSASPEADTAADALEGAA